MYEKYKLFINLSTTDMSGLTKAQIDAKKAKETRQKLTTIWDARKKVTVPNVRNVTSVEVDVCFHGVDWEPEFTTKGKGNAVSNSLYKSLQYTCTNKFMLLNNFPTINNCTLFYNITDKNVNQPL